MQLLTLQTVVIVGLLALALLCFHLIIRAMLEEKSLQASPSPSGNGIWTSPVSIIIHGSVEEVFGAITNYKDYSWARGIRYQWERLSATGDPEVGSPGKVEVGAICNFRCHISIVELRGIVNVFLEEYLVLSR